MRLGWRRAGLAAGAAALLVGMAAVAVRWQAVRGLRERRLVLAALVTAARSSSEQAQERLRSGQFDLAVRAASPLVARLLAELEGYEQVTRRGNRFRIGKGETRFRDGHAELRASADFDWRLGLYRGPVEATYLAFARLTPDGGCDLYFRVAEVRTRARSRFFNWYLQPILTHRMQQRLEIPNVRLPLGLRHEVARPDVEKQVGPGIEIIVPDRPLGLGSRRVLPFITPDSVGVVVERRGREDPAAAAGMDAPPDEARPDGVEIAARVEFLSALLAEAVAPAEDLRLAVARIPRVWESRLLGFDNHADVVRLAGALDLRDTSATLRGETLHLEAALDGRFAGMLEGKLLGVDFAVPFKVRPRGREVLPVRLVSEESGLTLVIERTDVELPLDVEARVLRRQVRFRHQLKVPAAMLGRAVRLPGLAMTELEFPRRVERGQVLASKPVPVAIAWETLPPRGGLLRARGRVTIGPAPR
jgi:hypothetical protein